MTIKEKKWTNNIYELILHKNDHIRYKLSIFNYPASNIKIVKYNKLNCEYKELFVGEFNKENYIKCMRYLEYLVHKFRRQEYEQRTKTH